MEASTVTDWDDAYANGAHIPDADAYPDRWASAAAAFRATARRQGETFVPDGAPRGLVGLSGVRHDGRAYVLPPAQHGGAKRGVCVPGAFVPRGCEYEIGLPLATG